MKLYILIILFILITACTPQEVTDTKSEAAGLPDAQEQTTEDMLPEEPETPQEQTEDAVEESETLLEEEQIEETPIEENIIEIKEGAFDPKEKTIKKNTEIKWTNTDQKTRKIACYLEGSRVTTSPNLEEGDFFTYTFLEEGTYSCLDAIYGLRSTITVEAQ